MNNNKNIYVIAKPNPDFSQSVYRNLDALRLLGSLGFGFGMEYTVMSDGTVYRKFKDEPQHIWNLQSDKISFLDRWRKCVVGEKYHFDFKAPFQHEEEAVIFTGFKDLRENCSEYKNITCVSWENEVFICSNCKYIHGIKIDE